MNKIQEAFKIARPYLTGLANITFQFDGLDLEIHCYDISCISEEGRHVEPSGIQKMHIDNLEYAIRTDFECENYDGLDNWNGLSGGVNTVEIEISTGQITMYPQFRKEVLCELPTFTLSLMEE